MNHAHPFLLFSWRRLRQLPESLVNWALALAALLGAQLLAQSPYPYVQLVPTKIAKPAPNVVLNGGFENTAIVRQAYNPTWPGWTFTPQTSLGGSGIAKNGATVLAQSEPAPEGVYVAFLEGLGTISTNVPVTPGMWRIRFAAAQRIRGTTPNSQAVRVVINGSPVFEQQIESGSFAEYFTDIVTVTSTSSLAVDFLGLSNTGNLHVGLIDRVQLDPVLPWNAAASWDPSGVPNGNDTVLVPSDAVVALDGSCLAGSLQIGGDVLAAPINGSLAARWVLVGGPGSSFRVGTESAPFAQDFEVQLNAPGPGEQVLTSGTNFLMAMDGGTIDMHGLPKKSWTRLDSISLVPVTVGSPPAVGITVQDRSGWQVGDSVVLAYTGHVSHTAGTTMTPLAPYSGPRSQQRQILAINPVTGLITLAGSLTWADHCRAAAIQYQNPTNSQTWVLDQRAEVGMLSHNVRIVGASATAGFGGHVMIMACCDMMPTGFGRFSNVELTEMGQKQILGRYPMHWHMVRENGAGQYLRDSSVHQTHNRAITIHGSHQVTVERNVCFDIMGHAVFLEDGVERDNRILGNLVLATRKPGVCEQMLPHDRSLDQPQNRTPAAFWISHPDNEFVGNVAADSLGVGYWFALHRFPTGLSSTQPWIDSFSDLVGSVWVPWNATESALGKFEDNVAHSTKMGIDVHDSIEDGVGARNCPPPATVPTLNDPKDDDIATNVMWLPNPAAPISLERFTAYGCSAGIYTGSGFVVPSAVTFRNCVLADNGVQVQLASADTVELSVLVHDSGNGIFPTGTGPLGNGMSNAHVHSFEMGNAYVVYDGPGRLADNYLVGYDGATLGNLCYSEFGAARRHVNHVFRGLTFAGGNLPAVTFRDFAAEPPASVFAESFVWGIAIVDKDYSLTLGNPPNPNNPVPHTLITNHPMMHLKQASTGTTPDVDIGGNARLSPFSWGHLQVRYYVGLNMDGLLETSNVPTASFKRQTYFTWDAQKFDSTYLPSSQMRQLPVIVRAAGSAAPECVYEVEIRDPLPSQSTLPLRRVDLSIVYVAPGDVTRLRITHAANPTWNPVLYVNDAAAQIHYNGQHPSTLTAMNPGPPSTVSTYTRITGGPFDVIDLRMVNPNNTHRITITW